MSKHILVVDDEARIREVVEYALRREGFRVTSADSGREAIEVARAGGVDLVVLDVMLPDLGGLEVCRVLRADGRVPVLFLSARAEEVDRVVGLEIGGDDYLTKPFSPRELVARVRAVLRRVGGASGAVTQTPPAPPFPQGKGGVAVTTEPKGGVAEPKGMEVSRAVTLEHDGIEMDGERHEVRYRGRPLLLTPTEFGLLGALIERPGVVLSRGQLMQRAYPYDNLVTERTIDTHVCRIRAKFRAAGGDPIATVHGVGYKAQGG